MKRIVINNEEDFVKNIISNSLPVLMYFWADWCIPCKEMNNLLDELSVVLDDKLVVADISVDDFPEKAVKYNVRSLPSLIMIINDKEVFLHEGICSKDNLLKKINLYLK